MRVLIADDWTLLREALGRVLEESGFEVVAYAEDYAGVVRKAGAHRPDVAIIDVRMPPTRTDEGFRAAREIRERYPEVGLLLISQWVDEDHAFELLRHGAEGIGYLLKQRVAAVETFADAVRTIARGGSALEPEVISGMLATRSADDPLRSLSDRERAVLELVVEGRSNSAIAGTLFVSRHTVEKHITAIFVKLGIPGGVENHQRVMAVLTYLRHGARGGQAGSPPVFAH